MDPRRVLIVLAVAVLSACDDSTQKPVVTEKFEGILQTDELCAVIGGDTTDFLPRSDAWVDTTVFPPAAYPPTHPSLDGACPNPAETSTQVHFSLNERDSVWLFAYDEPGAAPVDTLFKQSARPGHYMITWHAPNGPGIYRLRMFTASGFQSYGDVEFTGP